MTDKETEFEAAFREISEGAADQQEAPDEGNTEDPQTPEETDSDAASAEPDDAGADQEPPAEPEEANQTDLWANATPEQRAAYEAAEERAKAVEQKLRSDEGRVARYQRDRDAMQRKLNRLVDAAQKDGEDLRALVASDEWKKTKTEYGDDLAPLFTALEKLTEHQSDVGERFKEMDAEELEQLEAANFETLDSQAPDWRRLVNEEDFVPWLQSQPKPWQDAWAQNEKRLVDPSSALELFNRYRVHAELKKQRSPSPSPAPEPSKQQDPRRARQLDGARSATSKAPIVADPGGDDWEAEFQRAAAAKEKKRAAR